MPANHQEVNQLANYCKAKLDLGHIELGAEYGYDNLALCVIDAVYSIGVNYASTRNTVARFCAYLRANIGGFAGEIPNDSEFSIGDLVALYKKHSLEFMATHVYQNLQRTSTRNGIPKAEAVLRVAQVLQKYAVNQIADMEKAINNPVFEDDFKKIPGQTSGVSLHYFYMLTGIETEIKPDRMVIRFIESALGRAVKMEECHPLLVEVCRRLGSDFPDLNPRSLDHAIWQFQRVQ